MQDRIMNHAGDVNHQDKESKNMLIIDRFEGEFAVVETSKGFINIPRADIPKTAKESDLLFLGVDENGTEARKKRIDGMMNSLFK